MHVVSSRAHWLSLPIATLAFAAFVSESVQAGETWDGGGSDSGWSTAANWNTVRGSENAPPNDGTADIVMAGITRLTPRVDVDWDINSLIFNNTAGAFGISGDPGVSLGIASGGIANQDAQLQILLLPIGLNASQTWSASQGGLAIGNTVAGHFLIPRTLTLAGANNIQISGAIINAVAINKTDDGTLTLNGLTTNTYTGGTTVSGGTLVLNRTGGTDRAVPGNLVIGDGVGTDTVRLDAAEQITSAAGTLVTVNSSGMFNLNGFDETIRDLTINGGNVATNGGILTVPGSLSMAGGTLTVNNDGELHTADVTRIGTQVGSTAVVSVDGADSAWLQFQRLDVGESGTGTLNITAGGRQHTGNIAVVGSSSTGVGEVNVSGPDSEWRVRGTTTIIGNLGTGTLNITDGGELVNNDPSTIRIGNLAGSYGEVVVDGPGSSLNAHPDGSILVANAGSGRLEVAGGGAVSGSIGYIGAEPGSTGEATIGGAGSIWTNSGDIFAGLGGHGTVSVTGGGQLGNRDGFIGYEAGSQGAVTIDGIGSTWINTRNLNVGFNGDGSLTVTNGGTVNVSSLLTNGSLGEIHGDGNVIGNVENSGLVSPGLSLGALNLDGNYTQSPSGELLIELAASSYDQLLITETATLAGTLTV
ncbi:MAG: autotransporter-associated beta strand repeat-containing protein, partial [Pirellulales bacterium]